MPSYKLALYLNMSTMLFQPRAQVSYGYNSRVFLASPHIDLPATPVPLSLVFGCSPNGKLIVRVGRELLKYQAVSLTIQMQRIDAGKCQQQHLSVFHLYLAYDDHDDP